jgi:hypothetical protein
MPFLAENDYCDGCKKENPDHKIDKCPDLKKKCKNCGKPGRTRNGYCLYCVWCETFGDHLGEDCTIHLPGGSPKPIEMRDAAKMHDVATGAELLVRARVEVLAIIRAKVQDRVKV